MRTTPAETEQTTKNIIDAAIRVFSEKGFEATNMQDIATEAKVSRGPLYYRFKTKDELYLAALRVCIERDLSNYTQIFQQDKNILEIIRDDLYYCTRGIRSEQAVFPFPATYNNSFSNNAEKLMQEYQQKLFSIKESAVVRAIQKEELRADTNPRSIVNLMFIFYYGLEHTTASETPLISRENIQQDIENLVILLKTRYS